MAEPEGYGQQPPSLMLFGLHISDAKDSPIQRADVLQKVADVTCAILFDRFCAQRSPNTRDRSNPHHRLRLLLPCSQRPRVQPAQEMHLPQPQKPQARFSDIQNQWTCHRLHTANVASQVDCKLRTFCLCCLVFIHAKYCPSCKHVCLAARQGGREVQF